MTGYKPHRLRRAQWSETQLLIRGLFINFHLEGEPVWEQAGLREGTLLAWVCVRQGNCLGVHHSKNCRIAMLRESIPQRYFFNMKQRPRGYNLHVPRQVRKFRRGSERIGIDDIRGRIESRKMYLPMATLWSGYRTAISQKQVIPLSKLSVRKRKQYPNDS